MDIPAFVPVTIYAIFVLAFIALYAWLHLDDSAGRKPFALLAVLVAFQLTTDLVSRLYVYSGVPIWLVVLCTYINFLVLPFIGVSWYRFVRKVLAREEGSSLRKLDYVVYAIAAVGVVVLFANPFAHCVFAFDATGTYSRSYLYFVPALSAGLCMVVSQVLLVHRSRALGQRALLVMHLFPVAPIIGAVAATLVYGLPWLPLGISLSMLMLFASTFASGMNTDFLTSVLNRRRIEELLEERIEDARGGKPFAGLMVDIDNFKRINDTMGHHVGDIALADAARLLKESLRGVDVVGRFGGDEFFALIDVASEEELETVISRIRDGEVRISGERKAVPLRLSKGYALFDPDRFANAKEFEVYLDGLMYADKETHRLNEVKGQS
ncbi:MAG: diguanylate cyclase [Eggerthellaceae bacterium]|nr:diguanylate cyclase [Eggerthellaceae bacterium]